MRSLTEHHAHATKLTQRAMEAFDDGSPVFSIPLPHDGLLILQPKLPRPSPAVGSIRLCLYWATYAQIDEKLRDCYPVRDPG